MVPDAYISILEAPLDPYTTPDVGDDKSGDGKTAFRTTPSKAMFATPKQPPVPIVPFARPISLGSRGADVVGAKRAIWKANGLGVPKGATKLFGPIAVSQLKTFQQAHGLTPDGVLGATTLRKLGPFFDQYAFFLYTGYPPNSTKQQQLRALMVSYAVWAYNSRAAIHYVEFRPMTGMNQLEALPVTEDCSTFATKDYKYAGAPDPNGYVPQYPGWGNTTTMRQHGRVVSATDARPGDLAQYDNPGHVGIYVGNGRVISHGSEDGPSLSDLYYRPLTEIRTYLDGV